MLSGDRVQRTLTWLLIAAVSLFLTERLFGLMARFATPLLLFALAWLIALILQPMVNWMTQLSMPVPLLSQRIPNSKRVTPAWRLPRGIAVLLVYLALIAIISFLVISLVPIIETQLFGLEQTIPSTDEISRWLITLETRFEQLGYRGDLPSIVQPGALAEQVTTLGTTVFQQSLGIASGIATLVFNLILILILSFYMTMDGPRLAEGLLEMLPPSWHHDTLRFFTIVNQTFGGFLRAQLVQALVYGLATALLMTALGLNYIALVSVFAALLVLIPLVGGVFALFPPLLVALIETPDRMLLLFIALIVVQQVLFNIIMPRLMGQIVGLHPLLVFAAILIGGTLAGGWGILFGIPIAGVISSALHFIYLRTNAARTPPTTDPPLC